MPPIWPHPCLNNEGQRLLIIGNQSRCYPGMYGLGGKTCGAVEGGMGIEDNKHWYFGH